MFYALFAIVAIVVIGGFIMSRLEGLAFLAPATTKQLNDSALDFCDGDCRLEDGRCPLQVPREECPLWRFVNADVPTHPHGSPFVTQHAG